MTHLPLDPFSILALLCAAAVPVISWHRRRRERAHLRRMFGSLADVGGNERGVS